MVFFSSGQGLLLCLVEFSGLAFDDGDQVFRVSLSLQYFMDSITGAYGYESEKKRIFAKAFVGLSWASLRVLVINL